MTNALKEEEEDEEEQEEQEDLDPGSTTHNTSATVGGRVGLWQ